MSIRQKGSSKNQKPPFSPSANRTKVKLAIHSNPNCQDVEQHMHMAFSQIKLEQDQRKQRLLLKVNAAINISCN